MVLAAISQKQIFEYCTRFIRRKEENRYYLILANDLESRDISKVILYLKEVSKLLDSYINVIEKPR